MSKAPFSYLLLRRWDFGIRWMPRCSATRHHYHLYHHHHLDAVARAKRVADCLPLAPRVLLPPLLLQLCFLYNLRLLHTTLLLFSQSVDIGRTVYKTNDGRFSLGWKCCSFLEWKTNWLLTVCLWWPRREKINCQAQAEKNSWLYLLINWVSSLNR